MNLVDLFVLRRVDVLGNDRLRRTAMPALVADCADIPLLRPRLLGMAEEGALAIDPSRRGKLLSVTPAGRAALDAEPTRYRESMGFTNR